MPGETTSPANRYPNGYPSEPDLMQLAEQLSDRLTAEELGALAGMLAERAEAIRQ